MLENIFLQSSWREVVNNTHNLQNYSLHSSPFQFSFGSSNEGTTIISAESPTEHLPIQIARKFTDLEIPQKNSEENAATIKTAGSLSLEKTKLYIEDDTANYNWEYDSYNTNLLRSFLKYNDPLQISTRVQCIQRQLNNDEACYIDSSNNNPQLFILPDSVLITAEKVGKGSQSSVFRTNKHSQGSPIIKCIVKVAKSSYVSEFNLLQRFLNADALNSPYIDHMQACYSIINSKIHLAIFENSDGDLAHADYEKVASPIKFLVTQIRQIVEGITLLHQSNIVHRDIKGENCLINYHGVGKITDTGSARLNLDKEIHKTNYTPLYAPPFIWPAFRDQAASRGYQGKDADVFSTGITIEYDGIIPLLNYYATTCLATDADAYNCFFELQEKIMNAREEINVNSLEELSALGSAYPGRVSLISKVALIFPDRDQLLEDTLRAIQLFARHLSILESNSLRYLAKLAYGLINYNSNVIPSIESAKKDLDYICNLETSANKASTNAQAGLFETILPAHNNPASKQIDNRNTSSPTKTKKRSLYPEKSLQLQGEQEGTTKKMKTEHLPEKAEDSW